MKTLLAAELIRDNARVHGVAFAAREARRHGANIDTVLWALGLRRVGCRG